jgi:hypothetical protein
LRKVKKKTENKEKRRKQEEGKRDGKVAAVGLELPASQVVRREDRIYSHRTPCKISSQAQTKILAASTANPPPQPPQQAHNRLQLHPTALLPPTLLPLKRLKNLSALRPSLANLESPAIKDQTNLVIHEIKTT